MTRFSKTNRQGQGKSAPIADTKAGYKTAPYRMGGFRQPTYQPDTRFSLTDKGRAYAEGLKSQGREWQEGKS